MSSASGPGTSCGKQQSERHGQQDHRVEDEGRKKSAPQVRGLADGRGVEERIHPRLHVSRCRIAGQLGGDQQPHHAAEKGHDRDDERRVEEVAVATRVVDIDFPRHVVT